MAENTIAQEMKELDYTPADMKAWEKLSEKEQRQVLVRKRNEREMVAARGTVRTFMETKEFGKLPENVQAAIKRVCGKPAGSGLVARPSIIKTVILPLLPKVGAKVSELDVFKATKMGRAEMRKKVREYLKSCEPADRHWIEFDEKTESWTLLSVGAAQPKGFQGKAID